MYFLTIVFPTPSFKHTLNNILFIVIYKPSSFQLGDKKKSLLDVTSKIWNPILGSQVCFWVGR